MGLFSFLSKLTKDDDEDKGVGPGSNYNYDHDGYLARNGPLAQPDQSDIAVRGDPWKPHKDTILGAIADAVASYTDDGTPFQDERNKRNMIEASKGLYGHPDEAVSRIAKFDPTTAWKLRSQVADDQRGDRSQQRLDDVADMNRKQKVYGQVASMMNVAAKRPENWQQMRQQALNYAQQYNVDVSQIIPENYDQNALETIAQGMVPVAKQMSTAEQVRNHDLQHDDRREGHSIGRERNQIMREQGGARIGISEENAETARQNAETARRRAQVYANTNQGRAVNSPAGPGVVDKSGNQLTVFAHDGRKLLYIRGKDGNHWKFAHQVIDTEEKASGLPDMNIDPDDPEYNQ